MARKYRRYKKRKGKIKLKQSVALVPKDSVKTETIKQAPFQPLRDVGASFRVKIRRKN